MIEQRTVTFRHRLEPRDRDTRTLRRASGRYRAARAVLPRHRRPRFSLRRAYSRDAARPCIRATGTARCSGTSSACNDATRVCRVASACTSRSLCSFAMRGQSFISPSKSGGSTRRYSGGSTAIARSRSRIPERCSSRRVWSSPGSLFFNSVASSRTASRILRFRLTQPSSCTPNKRSNKPVRNHLGRQRPFIARPAHIALHAFAERFLRHTDLQRPEARIAADLVGDHLIDGRSARSTAGKVGAGHQAAHRIGVAVAFTVGGRVVETAQHVNVFAPGCERRQTRRDFVIGPSSVGIQ